MDDDDLLLSPDFYSLISELSLSALNITLVVLSLLLGVYLVDLVLLIAHLVEALILSIGSFTLVSYLLINRLLWDL